MGVYVGLGGDGEPKPYKSWGYDQEGREGYESCSVPPPPPSRPQHISALGKPKRGSPSPEPWADRLRD